MLGREHRKIGPVLGGYGTYTRRILSTRPRQVSDGAALSARFVLRLQGALTSHRFTDTCIAALVRVAEPIAITSIFPYAWKLVLHFEIGDRSNASFYAGILIAAFALAEACSSVYVQLGRDYVKSWESFLISGPNG